MIEATRSFICIRPATYENAAEAKYLEGVFKGRAGTLENTVFALMTPDGTQYLTRTGRSPNFVWRDAASMAKGLKELAARYPAKGAPLALPTLHDFRLALNVASCDSMPLLTAVGPKETAEVTLARLAWHPELLGKWAYAPVPTENELAAAGLSLKPGILALEPDTYGQKATVLSQWPLDTPLPALLAGLKEAQKRHKGEGKDPRQHIRQGERLGVLWKSLLPNTDPNGPPQRR